MGIIAQGDDVIKMHVLVFIQVVRGFCTYINAELIKDHDGQAAHTLRIGAGRVGLYPATEVVLHNTCCHLAPGGICRTQEQDLDFLLFCHGHLKLIME